MNPALALIITNIIWGAASPVFKLSLENIPPFILAFFRFFVGSFVFLFLAIKHWQHVSRKDWIFILLAGFFGITVNISFFFMALQKTASINAPVIASAQPIFLYLFSVLFLKEKPHPRVFFGILLSFIGVLVIILSPLLQDGSLSRMAKETAIEGNIFLIIATFGSVVHVLLLKNVLKRVNFFQVTFVSFLVSSLLFLPMVPHELGTWSFALLDWRGLTGIIFGVFLSSALAYFLFNYGISKLDAQEIGIFTYIDPVIAVLLAIPLVHEYPTVTFYLGSFFIFTGILVAEGRLHWHPFHKLWPRSQNPL